MSKGNQRRQRCHTGQSHGNSLTWKFPPRDILTECRKQQRSTMCIMGRESKKGKSKPRPSGGSSGSRVNAGNTGKPSGKGKKVPLPTDICWRCGKGRHQKGQPCKAVEAVCRNCGTKGHYEKVCMKKSTHLVNVPGTSTNSEPGLLQ